ncbi:DUF2490 domain-containing protein [Robiginitalea sp. M366]|uniref:DUF2490 domain-containing protein n=1 Tax=Robiginitalea aestuariiviva TaxID=3036903 RepID=UPI00240CE81F|nr:DUF2490 domain-containing protein [Robiginitalea aestuariiviva]MDG1573418.1 DUF2490 domain-containing protein [Robiginitalea aestuariiviva]
MKQPLRALLALTLVWLGTAGAHAQEEPRGIGAWYIYFADYGLSERLSIHHETHLHFHGTLQGFNRFIVRPGVNYRLANGLVGSLVYSYMYSDPTFEDALPRGNRSDHLQEHRIMEQFVWRSPLGSFRFSHRLRIEQRFFNDEGERFTRHRLRYRALASRPLTRRLYANADAEALLTPHQGGIWNYRLGASLGVRLNPQVRLQAGYVRFFSPNGQDQRLKFILLFNPDLRPKILQP